MSITKIQVRYQVETNTIEFFKKFWLQKGQRRREGGWGLECVMKGEILSQTSKVKWIYTENYRTTFLES